MNSIRTDIATVKLKDELFNHHELTVSVARLDEVHPVISGNKYFKLKYNIEAARSQQMKGIITFGGAYSNHLAATAFACREKGLSSIAVVRGEEPSVTSHTLDFCKECGMQLLFVSRSGYSDKQKLYDQFQNKYPDHYLLPEGGDNEAGEKGCTEIIRYINESEKYTHIVCDIGTGTTFKGLVKSVIPQQKVVGIVVLKGTGQMNEALREVLASHKNYHLVHDYHFGGYAKKTQELIRFMNQFYDQHQIPSDFVYTGKLFYAVYDLIRKNYFPPGSNILCLHTGGLQGNLSLPAGTLNF